MEQRFGDVSLAVDANHVATVEMHRPPANFFDVELMRSLADAYSAVDRYGSRVVVLCSEGKHFCAGADFGSQSSAAPLGVDQAAQLYAQAVRLFQASTPVVAAVEGAAIGGGLGLACSADFRVGSSRSRFSANFSRLGFHHGFGLTVTLPRIVGAQRAAELLYTGRRIAGPEAYSIGLCDRLAAEGGVRSEAMALALEIAAAAPLAVRAIRGTMRAGLAEAVKEATKREDAEQARLRSSADFAEGIAASAERREPNFVGA